MPPPADSARDNNPRFPGASLRPGGGLYARCPLSSRDGEALRGERGGPGRHAAVRPWGWTCGQEYAQRLRRWRPQPGEPEHREEVWVPRSGERHDLGRAGAQADNGLALLGQRRCNQRAAPQGCRTLLKGGQYGPRVSILEKRQSASAAMRARRPGGEQRQRRSHQQRWANAQRPTRQREERIPGGQSGGQAQRGLSADGPRAQHVRPRRPRGVASDYRPERRQRGTRGAARTGTQRAASGLGRPGGGDPCVCGASRLQQLDTTSWEPTGRAVARCTGP
jgi:transposase-like protein